MKPKPTDAEMADAIVNALWSDTFEKSAIAKQIRDAIATARAQERERCAQIIEKRGTNNVGMVHPISAADAAAIRGTQP